MLRASRGHAKENRHIVFQEFVYVTKRPKEHCFSVDAWLPVHLADAAGDLHGEVGRVPGRLGDELLGLGDDPSRGQVLVERAAGRVDQRPRIRIAHVGPGLPRAGLRPRERSGPPGHQAREHSAGFRPRRGGGFRHRGGSGEREHRAAHRQRCLRRHDGVHESRTGGIERSRHRHSVRYLLAGVGVARGHADVVLG